MIFLWFKITTYKIIKAFRPSTRAVPEAEGVGRAGAHETQDADRYPATRDALNLDLLHAEREARETRAALTHDPRHCPCAGRHYPSPSACRWCACHDPDDVHHSFEHAKGIMQRLPAKKIVVCSVCDHAPHRDGSCTGYTFNERCECPGSDS